MTTWQKKIQQLIREIGRKYSFQVSEKEFKYYVRSSKPYWDYNDKIKQIQCVPLIPDVEWKLKRTAVINFEIEPKGDKWLIGSIMNGLFFAEENESEFVLIVKSEKKAEFAWNFLNIFEDKFDTAHDKFNFPRYSVYYFSNQSKKSLKKRIIKDFKKFKLL